LPDRLAHLRKIAERIKLDQPEFAAHGPERKAGVPGRRLWRSRPHRDRVGSRSIWVTPRFRAVDPVLYV
jgi:hypothetical protein